MHKRILVVDDSIVVRGLVRQFIESRPGFEICGEASDGLEGVEKGLELKPDLIILDFSMPRINGLQAALMLHEIVPGIPIILFTIYKDPVLSRLARNAGVTSVVSMTDRLSALADEVQRLTAAALVRMPTVVCEVQLWNIEVENAVDVIRPDVQQDNITTNDDVPATAILRGRWQTPLQVCRHRLNFLLQSRRQSASLAKLLFETRRQPVSLGKPWGKVILMLVIPLAHGVFIMRVEPVVFVGILVLVFILAVSVPVSIPLCKNCAGIQQE